MCVDHACEMAGRQKVSLLRNETMPACSRNKGGKFSRSDLQRPVFSSYVCRPCSLWANHNAGRGNPTEGGQEQAKNMDKSPETEGDVQPAQAVSLWGQKFGLNAGDLLPKIGRPWPGPRPKNRRQQPPGIHEGRKACNPGQENVPHGLATNPLSLLTIYTTPLH